MYSVHVMLMRLREKKSPTKTKGGNQPEESFLTAPSLVRRPGSKLPLLAVNDGHSSRILIRGYEII